MKKLKVLPSMRCDTGCGECCGVVPVTETEFRRVERYVTEHRITPIDGEWGVCPLYQKGTCAVYPVRPLICQVFGHVERLPCSRGYNVNIDQRQADRMTHANGEPTRLLHELIPRHAEAAKAWKAQQLIEKNP